MMLSAPHPNQPKGFEPGIYFNMHEDKYHNDPAFNHSGMVNILTHPREYWEYSPLNPARTFKETDAMTYGKRCHSYLLEPDNFFKKYHVAGTKGGFDHKKVVLTPTEFYKIREAVDNIKQVPAAAKMFTDGYPEVTIIWDDPRTGIRCRIRLDWLRTFGGFDYKRCKDIQNNGLGWAIAEFGYDLQEALYRRGISEIKRLLREGKVKAHGLYDVKWLERFIADPRAGFAFIFQRSTRPFIFRIDEFDQEIQNMAETRIEDALDIYNENITAYGAEPWPPGDAKIGTFSIYHLPRRYFDQGVK